MVFVVIWLASALIGRAFGSRPHTRRGTEGFALGLVLGPVGLLMLAALGPSRAARREQIQELVDAASWARFQVPSPTGGSGSFFEPARSSS
jgi:hypothetical protein